MNGITNNENIKKARVSHAFKQKALETSQNNTAYDDLFYDESNSEIIKKELIDCEGYFTKKIEFYLKEFEEERMFLKSQICSLEKDLEEAQMAQLDLLLKIKDFKDKAVEMECKMKFYKNRIKENPENGK
jgi:hypothetical protein